MLCYTKDNTKKQCENAKVNVQPRYLKQKKPWKTFKDQFSIFHEKFKLYSKTLNSILTFPCILPQSNYHHVCHRLGWRQALLSGPPPLIHLLPSPLLRLLSVRPWRHWDDLPKPTSPGPEQLVSCSRLSSTRQRKSGARYITWLQVRESHVYDGLVRGIWTSLMVGTNHCRGKK